LIFKVRHPPTNPRSERQEQVSTRRAKKSHTELRSHKIAE
jgi:hypothetical protein